MRHKFYFGLLLICFSLNTSLFAQNFWVPDANFRAVLKIKYPSCFTVQDSLITTCSSIQNDTVIDLSYKQIADLSGLEYFVSLKRLDCYQNQLSSLPILPNSLTYINLGNNQFTNFPILPPNLITLACGGNQFTAIPTLPALLSNIFCNNGQLTSLPTLPPALKQLNCSDNQLASLPALPPTLYLLNCSDNQLTSLPALPPTIDQVDCSFNQLTSLPTLPNSVYHLFCTGNLLNALPALPSSLTDLWCNTNSLTSLPNLPSTISQLHCDNNNLTNLPTLPSNLLDFTCSYNQLTSLPNLPSSLTSMSCTSNQLSFLPSLPNNLLILFCSNNQLTSISNFGNLLHWIDCSNNLLSSLPALPDSLTYFICSNNQLSNFPPLPSKLRQLYCDANPIFCLPTLPNSLFYLYIYNTSISCLPNKPSGTLFCVPPKPLCTPLSNGCNYIYTRGFVFLDSNSNGILDSLEPGISLPVYFGGYYVSMSDTNGFFTATSSVVGNTNFKINKPNYYNSTTSVLQTINTNIGTIDTLYFGLNPIPNIKDLKIDLTANNPLRPGFKVNYTMHYQNIGTDTITNIKLKFLKPLKLSNLSSLPASSSIIGDTLIWDIPVLFPFQQKYIFIHDSVFANAAIGDTAIAYSWIEPLVSDSTPLNNKGISFNIMRNSFDPNDKSVSPDSVLPNSSDYLEYSIRFQNTGTDTAFSVYLSDTLSTNLDVSTIEMISASNSYTFWVENHIAKWSFDNILLPDSNINEADSHGFVKFRINTKANLSVGIQIPNTANIYFDYNTAVTTNTIVVNVLNPLQVKEFKETALQVFPNPVQESLRIVNQHAGPLGKIELINASGKVLETKTITGSTYTWNTQHLPAGTYILKGLGWGQKVVKN